MKEKEKKHDFQCYFSFAISLTLNYGYFEYSRVESSCHREVANTQNDDLFHGMDFIAPHLPIKLFNKLFIKVDVHPIISFISMPMQCNRIDFHDKKKTHKNQAMLIHLPPNAITLLVVCALKFNVYFG